MRSMRSRQDGRPTLIESPAPTNRTAWRLCIARASSSITRSTPSQRPRRRMGAGLTPDSGEAVEIHRGLDQHSGRAQALLAEDAQVALHLIAVPGRLLRVVGQLYRGPAFRPRDLANQRDRVDAGERLRRAAAEVVGQVR